MVTKFDVSPPSSRTVLQLLPKPRLVEISRGLGVVVKLSATKEEQVNAPARKGIVALPEILRALAVMT